MEHDSALLESVAQHFRRDMWMSAAPAAIAESGIEIQRFGPVQATAFGDLPDAVNLNQIQGAAEPGAIEDGYLTAAIEWMRAREVHPRVAVADCRPEASAADEWLGDRGYEQVDGWVKFVRDPRRSHPSADPSIVVYELGTQAIDGEALSAIIAEGMNLPAYAGTLFFSLPEKENWRCYTAALAPEEPVVATGLMRIEDGVAQLGPGHTLPHARGRGCNMALLRRRLIDAAKAGCHTAVVELWDSQPEQLSQAGRNLCRAGFDLAYAGHSWQRPALHPAVH
jgi:GNAT superfamily N-acetyltransferase